MKRTDPRARRHRLLCNIAELAARHRPPVAFPRQVLKRAILRSVGGIPVRLPKRPGRNGRPPEPAAGAFYAAVLAQMDDLQRLTSPHTDTVVVARDTAAEIAAVWDLDVTAERKLASTLTRYFNAFGRPSAELSG